jgi:hypothetical protein
LVKIDGIGTEDRYRFVDEERNLIHLVDGIYCLHISEVVQFQSGRIPAQARVIAPKSLRTFPYFNLASKPVKKCPGTINIQIVLSGSLVIAGRRFLQ